MGGEAAKARALADKCAICYIDVLHAVVAELVDAQR